MGLFDRAKAAFGGNDDWAAQAQAAQQAANQALKDAGYTDGAPVTMANADAVSGQMQADHDVLNAYGQELNRIIAVGQAGSSLIVGLTDTGERTSGNPWYLVDVDVTLPGQEPYRVQKREMIAPQFLGNYAEGSRHDISVDPADPTKTAFTS